MKTCGRIAFLGGVAWLALAAAPSLAQDAEAAQEAVAPAPSAAAAAEFDDSVDIIVTAQRRAQTVNSVPMSINAITGDTLAARGISSTADLTRLVPGFTFTQSQVATPVYTLRGVGFYDSTLSASPAVSVYVDEVPLPFAILTPGATLDIQRVEVLKGPQGTLYGQNATGGAINYISNKPSDAFEAGADATLARFGAFDVSGYVSGPITDTLGIRIAVKTEQGGAWQQSYTRDDSLGKANRLAGRAILVWKPLNTLTFTGNLNAWSDKSDVQAPQLTAHTPYNPANALPQVLAVPLAPSNARAANWSADWPMQRDDTFYQGSIRADWEFGDDVKLTSISSWLRFTTDATQDLDGTEFLQLDSLTPGYIRSFFQEFRLIGSSGPIRWIAGVNYERDKAGERQVLRTDDISSRVIIPGLPNLTRSGVFTNQAVSTYAVYGNLEYDITERLTAQGGVRYTKNVRDFDGCGYDADGTSYLSFNVLTEIFTGASPNPPIPPGGCLTFNEEFQPSLIVDRLSQDNVSWRTGLTYTFDNRAIVYGNISKGWKAGGFPTAPVSVYTGFLPATQEALLAFEAGFKLPLADRTVQLNAAAFYYDYDNKQVRGRIKDEIFGLLERLVNVPKSHIYGAEAELVWTPGNGLTTSLSGTWIKAEIDEFSGYNGTGVDADWSGSPMPFTPEWQIMGDVHYRWSLSGDWDANVGASGNYNSATNSTFGNPDILSINARALFDVRAGIESSDGRLRAQLWGRNIFNTYYWNTTFQADTAWKMAGRPATYGITLGWRY